MGELYHLQPSSCITVRAHQGACSTIRGATDYSLYSQPWLWLIAFSKHQLGAGCDYMYFFFPFRFLILEHVSGGELFDHLVKRGRLPLGEVIL